MAKRYHDDGKTLIERYAFIDVYNTDNTTRKVLGFTIDWEKLYKYLKGKWNCQKVYFFAGIEPGDMEKEQEYDRLKGIGYEMRTKRTMVYKVKDRTVELTCMKCHLKQPKIIDMGYTRKSNCDVELTMEVMLRAKPKVDLMILTGDGDFTKLIEYAQAQGSTIKVVAYTRRGEPTHQKRLSTILKSTFQIPGVNYVDINSWKDKVKIDASTVI